MTGLRCTADRGYPVALLHLTGRLDARTAPDVRAAVLDCLADEPDTLIVDLSGLTATDDAGETFTALARQASIWPGSALVLAHASGALAAAADVPCYPSVWQARQAPAHEPPPPRVRESLPPATVAAPLARRVVTHACADWAVPELCDPAQLIVTELVANGVRHAGSPMTLTVSLRDGQLQISVLDQDPRLPDAGRATPADEHGRGLRMVEALGSGWGTMRVRDGKVVWARVAVPARTAGRQIARRGGE